MIDQAFGATDGAYPGRNMIGLILSLTALSPFRTLPSRRR